MKNKKIIISLNIYHIFKIHSTCNMASYVFYLKDNLSTDKCKYSLLENEDFEKEK